jgi:hypothetical protein
MVDGEWWMVDAPSWFDWLTMTLFLPTTQLPITYDLWSLTPDP